MEEYKGQEVTISYVCSDGDYTIEEDGGERYWNDLMFKNHSNKSKEIQITFDGLKTIATLDDKQGIARCNPHESESYDENTGMLISVCRLLGIDTTIKSKELEDYSISELLLEVAKRVDK